MTQRFRTKDKCCAKERICVREIMNARRFHDNYDGFILIELSRTESAFFFAYSSFFLITIFFITALKPFHERENCRDWHQLQQFVLYSRNFRFTNTYTHAQRHIVAKTALKVNKQERNYRTF